MARSQAQQNLKESMILVWGPNKNNVPKNTLRCMRPDLPRGAGRRDMRDTPSWCRCWGIISLIDCEEVREGARCKRSGGRSVINIDDLDNDIPWDAMRMSAFK